MRTYRIRMIEVPPVYMTALGITERKTYYLLVPARSREEAERLAENDPSRYPRAPEKGT
jgi:hypothetical protein